jgi:uncharacterized protein YaiI (UPF0178 family)
MVITADSREVIARGALALDPRGELYAPDNIPEQLQMRNFMDQPRASCVRPVRWQFAHSAASDMIAGAATLWPLSTLK